MSDPEKQSYLVYGALVGGQVVFALIAVFVVSGREPAPDRSNDLLVIIGALVAVSSMAASFLLGRILMDRSMRLASVEERTASALRSIIVRSALLEAGGVLCLVLYFVTADIALLGTFGLVLLLFVARRPNAAEWERVRRGA
jgi:hypothetical protein